MTLPKDAAARKAVPVATGFVDYFPDAMAAVAELSRIGNDQHNPGKPLHWDRAKSTDEADCLMRHFVERGTIDTDGVRHSAKVAWRAMALLQKEIEASRLVAPDKKWNLAIGDRVRVCTVSFYLTGKVVGFDDEFVYVKTDQRGALEGWYSTSLQKL